MSKISPVYAMASSPPAGAMEGDICIVEAPGLAEFAGHDWELARLTSAGWAFISPSEGQLYSARLNHQVYAYFPSSSSPYKPFIPLNDARQVVTINGDGTIAAEDLDVRHTYVVISPVEDDMTFTLPAATAAPQCAVTIVNVSARSAMVGVDGGEIDGLSYVSILGQSSSRLFARGGGLQGTDWTRASGGSSLLAEGYNPAVDLKSHHFSEAHWQLRVNGAGGDVALERTDVGQTPLRVGAAAVDDLLTLGHVHNETVEVNGALRVGGVDVGAKLTELEGRLAALEAASG